MKDSIKTLLLLVNSIFFIGQENAQNFCRAQTLLTSPPLKINQTTIFQEKSTNYKINDISKNGMVLISETIGGTEEYYLVNAMSPNMIGEKKRVFSKQKDSRKERAFFALNDRYLLIHKLDGDQRIVEIYDTMENVSKEIRSNEGSIVLTAIFNMDNVLYEVKPQNGRLRLYLKNNENPNSLFITEGYAPKWSPNGNWFLTTKYQSSEMLYREKLDYGIISREQFKADMEAGIDIKKHLLERIPLVLCIYNRKGESVLEFDQFKEYVDWVRWAPNSDKLVLQLSGNLGFMIIYLKEFNGDVTIERIHSYSGFDKKGNNFYVCEEPRWSPDGSKISFIRTIEDGHRTLDSNLWILEDDSYNHYQISNFDDTLIKQMKWNSNNSLLVLKENTSNRTVELLQIDFD